MQLEDPERGFSFRFDGPLDMRFDPEGDFKADEIVNHMPQDELADVIKRFGEEPRARAIAEAIVQARPLKTTLELAEVVASKAARKRKGVHPATRTFQALRIAVNDELDALKAGLESRAAFSGREVGRDLLPLAGGSHRQALLPPGESRLYLPSRAIDLLL
jgi:16S rRNA (cytosine1402-N4)-methyltransferase